MRQKDIQCQPYINETMRALNQAFGFDLQYEWVPHIHGFIVRVNTPLGEIRELFSRIYPESRQVVVKELYEQQDKETAIGRWATYTTKMKLTSGIGTEETQMTSRQILWMMRYQERLGYNNGKFGRKYSKRHLDAQYSSPFSDADSVLSSLFSYTY